MIVLEQNTKDRYFVLWRQKLISSKYVHFIFGISSFLSMMDVSSNLTVNERNIFTCMLQDLGVMEKIFKKMTNFSFCWHCQRHTVSLNCQMTLTIVNRQIYLDIDNDKWSTSYFKCHIHILSYRNNKLTNDIVSDTIYRQSDFWSLHWTFSKCQMSTDRRQDDIFFNLA